MREAASKSLLSVIIFFAGGSLAIGQAGSTGGVIGKTDKSVSGGESPARPRGGSDKPSGASLNGRWRWSADCTVGHWQGEFDLSQTAGGNFNGSFAATSAHDVGTISDGRISGDNISFTRTSSIATQYWKGRITAARMRGTSSGNANCSWQATRR
jgi:hypothetical protein